MKINLITLSFFLCFPFFSSAQILQWENLIDGGLPDRGCCITETADGDIILVGNTLSTNGDIPNNAGGADALVARVRPDGQIRWLKTYGGNALEAVHATIRTTDGAVVVAGNTESTNGVFANNHGGTDAYIFKIDGAGELLWQRVLGGSEFDEFSDMVATPDGGVLVVGFSSSNDGDISHNIEPLFSHTGGNAWMVKLDATGEIEWQQIHGGTHSDGYQRLVATPDGGYLLAGNSQSNDLDVSENYGNWDTWIVKTDAQGEIEWQRNLGGSELDLPEDMLVTSDGYRILLNTRSADFDIPDNRGESDNALVALSFTGEIKWVNTFGGLKNDYLEQLNFYEGEQLLISGRTLTQMRPELPRFGGSHWLMVVDENGETISERFGSLEETGFFKGMHRNRDGSFSFVGTTDVPVNGVAPVSLGIWYGRYLSAANLLTGEVYVDVNNNGERDAGDLLTQNTKVQTESGEFDLATYTTDGDFLFYLQEGGYLTSVVDVVPYFSVANNEEMSSFSEVNQTDTLSFRLLPLDPIPEIVVNLIPRTAARPGFAAAYDLVIQNNGNIDLAGEVSVQYPVDKINFVDATAENLSSEAGVLTFAFTDLRPFQQQKIRLNFRMKTLLEINLSDLLEFVSTVPIYTAEITGEDNVDTLYQEITGSYDPNDKTILNKDTIAPEQLAGHTMDYLIRFQNTGNDTAFNVVLRDTFSINHVGSTFKLLAASHPYRISLDKDGRLAVFFDDILLPDSTTNEAASNGYFNFQIDLQAPVPVDSTIHNTAFIYFDYNPPIVTNTAKLKIYIPPVVNNLQNIDNQHVVNIFSNPVKRYLSIEIELEKTTEVQLKIVNVVGEILYQEQKRLGVGAQNWQIDCRKFPAGQYVVHTNIGAQSWSEVFVKIRG